MFLSGHMKLGVRLLTSETLMPLHIYDIPCPGLDKYGSSGITRIQNGNTIILSTMVGLYPSGWTNTHTYEDLMNTHLHDS